MKATCLSIVLALLLPLWAEFSGEVGVEFQAFPHKGAYGQEEQLEHTLLIQPEYSRSWNQDRRVFTFIPYARLGSHDEERNHFDIRELSFIGSWPVFDLRAGISKVFWGVTESQHLVDVVNQTDAVENIDGEDKLGQPMIHLTWVQSFGNVEFFWLPYFRERLLPGEDGRFRGPVAVDQDQARYTDDREEWHQDLAFRWSHYVGALDWGLSYFRGTDRDPVLELDEEGRLIPVYGQSWQLGLELQIVYLDWLFKGEFLHKERESYSDYQAWVTGFEYTFVNLGPGADIGVLYEWLYDDRGRASGSGLDDASFVGTRLAMNDEASSELLFGGFIDHQSADVVSLRLEASRRLGASWKLEVEGTLIEQPPENSFFDAISRDDYLQVTLSYFW